MSHFTVLIASKTEDVEDLLEPYNENTEVAPYWTDEDFDYLRDNPNVKEDLTNNSSIEEIFAFVQEHYADDLEDDYRLKDGVIQRHTTYNPDSKWDWYAVGGRWAGQLELRRGAEGRKPEFGWQWATRPRISGPRVSTRPQG